MLGELLGEGNWHNNSERRSSRESRGNYNQNEAALRLGLKKPSALSFLQERPLSCFLLWKSLGVTFIMLQFWPLAPFPGGGNPRQIQWLFSWRGQFNQYSQLCWLCNTTVESFVWCSFLSWWDRQVWRLHRVELAPLWWLTGCHSLGVYDQYPLAKRLFAHRGIVPRALLLRLYL